MNFATWSIKNPLPSITLFIVLTIIGLFSFFRLPVTELPNIDLPAVMITVTLPNGSPDEMVSRVLKPLETEIGNISGLRHMEATAKDGYGSIVAIFQAGEQADVLVTNVKDAVTTARGTMPDTINEPLVAKLNFSGSPVLTYSVQDPSLTQEELSKFIDDQILPVIQTAKAVGSAQRLGGGDLEVLIDLDLNTLTAYQLDINSVNSQISSTNINVGSGEISSGLQKYALRSSGETRDIAKFANTPILSPSGAIVPLHQLGTVKLSAKEPVSFAHHNGADVIAVGVYRASGESDLSAANNARIKMQQLAVEYPSLTLKEIDDATVNTKGSYDSAMMTLIEGAVLAMIVVFLFLRDWRATLVALAALPLSIIPTFFVIDMLGYSLNMLSLLAITLVTGILVDDAIVEIENVDRHLKMGKTPVQAAADAAQEIGLTVIAISLSIVAVFAPVAFMSGIAGMMFKQFGITVSVAVLFSLLVARLITPMMAAYIMKPGKVVHSEVDGPLMQAYLKSLNWTLKHRAVTLILGLFIFAASIFSATLLPGEFMPNSDTGRTQVAIELPPGSELRNAIAVAQEAQQSLSQIPEIVSVFSDGSSATNITLDLNYGDKKSRNRNSLQINEDIQSILTKIPDIKFHVMSSSAGGQASRPVNVNILADTQSGAEAAAQSIISDMKKLAEIRNVATAASLPRPEIAIDVNNEIAGQLGITPSAVASAVAAATAGLPEGAMPGFRLIDDRLSVRIRLDSQARNDLATLSKIQLRASSGAAIPLSVVADLSLTSGSSEISRYDKSYKITVQADLSDNVALGTAMKAINSLPVLSNLPPGVQLAPAGDAETMNEIFSTFGIAMATGIMLVYVVLVLLFNSFVTPITIMMSLPLAIGGAIFALYLSGSGIGISVVIGFLMLMGIVTKNAIMLVEFAKEAVHSGSDHATAIIDAAHKRAKPIVMTTIAMTAGMIPSALATSIGGEFRAPMAIAVIGGLLLSTALSLLFVPSLYTVMESGKENFVQTLKRLIRTQSISNDKAERPDHG